MFSLRHSMIFLLYAAPALAAVLWLPKFWPSLSGADPVLCGMIAFLAGALLHEIFARKADEAALSDKMKTVGFAISSLRTELNWNLNELDALRSAVGAPLPAGSDANHTEKERVDEVIAEVKILQSLIERLYSARSGDAPSAPASGDQAPTLQAPTARSRSGDEADRAAEEQRAVDEAEAAPRINSFEAAESQPAKPAEEAAVPKLLEPVPYQLSEEQILDVAREALKDDRIDLVLQPVVTLPQRHRRYYECFTRMRTLDGYYVTPEQYIGLAERAGLVTAIDNILLFRSIQLVRKIQRHRNRVDFFCNVSRRSWDDDDFFNDFIHFLGANPTLSENLIFEVAHEDFTAWSDEEAQKLERLAKLGCRLSLDQMRHLDEDPAALADRGIRFAKVEADLFMAAARKQPTLIGDWRSRGVNLIVEKIEDEATLTELLDYDIDLAQGFLFSEPRLARPAA